MNRIIFLLLVAMILKSCAPVQQRSSAKFPDKFDKAVFKYYCNEDKDFLKHQEPSKITYGNPWTFFIYDHDTIQINNSLSQYYPLFSSGILNPRLLISSGLLKIKDIIELSDPNEMARIHKLKITGHDIFNYEIMYMGGGFLRKIEIRGQNKFKMTDLDKNISTLKITCFVCRPIM